MVKENFDLNVTDDCGYSALHMCALSDNTHACAQLLKHGVDMELPDDAGRTPLQLAADRHRRGTYKKLVEHHVRLLG